MRAGRLRNKATIEANTPTRDAAGGEVASWATFATWWCELNQAAGGEAFRNRVVHAEANHVANGRYVAGVLTSMRVTLGSRVFEIKAVDNVGNRNRELRIDLLERL
jgi:SPP1 family predicted phage head-tail adaptor